MKRHMAMIGAIVRKDALLLWPLTVSAMILLATYTALDGEPLERMPQLIQVLLPVGANLAIGLLIVSALHADAPAGVRHEWLSRPVPRGALLAAKAIFVSAVVLIPSIIGEAIAAIRNGAQWSEVVLAATHIPSNAVLMVLLLCAIAAMTATVIEVMVIAIAIVGAALFVVPIILGLSGTGEEIYISGAAWLAEQPRVLFGFAVCVVLIWLMYSRRDTKSARNVFAIAAVLLILSPLVSPWRIVFAAQKLLAPDAAAANTVTLARDGACFRAMTVNPPLSAASTASDDNDPAWSANSPPAVLSSRLWTEAQRLAAGPDAIGFETRVTMAGAPRGWRTLIARVDGAYVGSEGRVLHKLRPARFTPTLRWADSSTQLVSHYWLVSRTDSAQLVTEHPQLSLDYSLSLLRPSSSVELAVDGVRRRIEGFGYCSARFDRATSTIKTECFKRGPQPAQMTANYPGASADTEVASDYPDYTPAALELIGGKRHVMTLRNVPQDWATRVKVTSYEAQAHFNRQVTSDGLLGARLDACPPPSP